MAPGPQPHLRRLRRDGGGSSNSSRLSSKTILLSFLALLVLFAYYAFHLHRLVDASLSLSSSMIPQLCPPSSSLSSKNVLPAEEGRTDDLPRRVSPPSTTCQSDYDRATSSPTARQTPGLTPRDFRRSEAWIGDDVRLADVAEILKSQTRPVTVVVAGGSISLGHGVTPESAIYAERLEQWMNEVYPLEDKAAAAAAAAVKGEGGTGGTTAAAKKKDATKKKAKGKDEDPKPSYRHRVINAAAHGADMCAMAKRLNVLYSDLPTPPDVFLLEFGVNDYQGQDHLITVDHKTDVFFEGFRDLTLCAEVVVHSLLTTFPNAAVVFLEMQTAVLTRKTGMLLHAGVATHYGIPMVSYTETMFPDFYRLIDLLKERDGLSYSFGMEDTSLPHVLGKELERESFANGMDVGGVVGNDVSSAVLPYPHGCSPCLPEHIIPQFRGGGCKSVCTYLERSGFGGLKCDVQSEAAKNAAALSDSPEVKAKSAQKKVLPAGREECFLPFFAHDAVHPSAVGHGIVKDLLVHALASAGRRRCEEEAQEQQQEVPVEKMTAGRRRRETRPLPMFPFVARSKSDLHVRGNFTMVRDVQRIFSRWDPLQPKTHTPGFKKYADDSLKQRPGWIATNSQGNESMVFEMDLPKTSCYAVYVAILRSYTGMGTMRVEVTDYHGETKEKTAVVEVDGLWEAPISVWSDVQITSDEVGRQRQTPAGGDGGGDLGGGGGRNIFVGACTGRCDVEIITNPMIPGRKGNKVKVLTLSARECASGFKGK